MKINDLTAIHLLPSLLILGSSAVLCVPSPRCDNDTRHIVAAV